MTLSTTNFGWVVVDESAAIEFPQGLPGFEECRRFVPLEHRAQPGLIFLQSMEQPPLCFLALPVNSVRPDYALEIAPDDLELLGLPPAGRPRIGKDVVALAILSVEEGREPSVNLLAPLVIHMETRRAVQAIRPDGGYQAREPLAAGGLVCS